MALLNQNIRNAVACSGLMILSQILPPLHPRRQPYSPSLGRRARPPESQRIIVLLSFDDLVYPALQYTECGTYPSPAAAFNALPGITS
jgi:hypothetical protein